MKVKELIEILQEMDPELPVATRDAHGNWGYGQETIAEIWKKGSYSPSFPTQDICLIRECNS